MDNCGLRRVTLAPHPSWRAASCRVKPRRAASSVKTPFHWSAGGARPGPRRGRPAGRVIARDSCYLGGPYESGSVPCPAVGANTIVTDINLSGVAPHSLGALDRGLPCRMPILRKCPMLLDSPCSVIHMITTNVP